ncbi:efflux RND transporter permease subunit, partial [Pseudomonadota bacterium]
MASFFRFFAERHLLAYLITTLIILLGISTLINIKRDSFPKVEFGELLITSEYPGASPEDVELKVTNEIEKELREVTGIKRYMSWSMENVSIVHILIDPDEKDEDKIITEI